MPGFAAKCQVRECSLAFFLLLYCATSLCGCKDEDPLEERNEPFEGETVAEGMRRDDTARYCMPQGAELEETLFAENSIKLQINDPEGISISVAYVDTSDRGVPWMKYSKTWALSESPQGTRSVLSRYLPREFETAKHKLSFQDDGNLVVYADGARPIWATGVLPECSTTKCVMVMNGSSCNLHIYNTSWEGDVGPCDKGSPRNLEDGIGSKVWSLFGGTADDSYCDLRDIGLSLTCRPEDNETVGCSEKANPDQLHLPPSKPLRSQAPGQPLPSGITQPLFASQAALLHTKIEVNVSCRAGMTWLSPRNPCLYWHDQKSAGFLWNASNVYDGSLQRGQALPRTYFAGDVSSITYDLTHEEYADHVEQIQVYPRAPNVEHHNYWVPIDGDEDERGILYSWNSIFDRSFFCEAAIAKKPAPSKIKSYGFGLKFNKSDINDLGTFKDTPCDSAQSVHRWQVDHPETGMQTTLFESEGGKPCTASSHSYYAGRLEATFQDSQSKPATMTKPQPWLGGGPGLSDKVQYILKQPGHGKAVPYIPLDLSGGAQSCSVPNTPTTFYSCGDSECNGQRKCQESGKQGLNDCACPDTGGDGYVVHDPNNTLAVFQNRNSGNTSQHWRIVDAGETWIWYVQNLFTGQYLCAVAGDSRARTCSEKFKWVVQPLGETDVPTTFAVVSADDMKKALCRNDYRLLVGEEGPDCNNVWSFEDAYGILTSFNSVFGKVFDPNPSDIDFVWVQTKNSTADGAVRDVQVNDSDNSVESDAGRQLQSLPDDWKLDCGGGKGKISFLMFGEVDWDCCISEQEALPILSGLRLAADSGDVIYGGVVTLSGTLGVRGWLPCDGLKAGDTCKCGKFECYGCIGMSVNPLNAIKKQVEGVWFLEKIVEAMTVLTASLCVSAQYNLGDPVVVTKLSYYLEFDLPTPLFLRLMCGFYGDFEWNIAAPNFASELVITSFKTNPAHFFVKVDVSFLWWSVRKTLYDVAFYGEDCQSPVGCDPEQLAKASEDSKIPPAPPPPPDNACIDQGGKNITLENHLYKVGKVRLIPQDDGNLVLWNYEMTGAIWSTLQDDQNTRSTVSWNLTRRAPLFDHRTPGNHMKFSLTPDGHVVLYSVGDGQEVAVWSSPKVCATRHDKPSPDPTDGRPGLKDIHCHLEVTDYCNIVVLPGHCSAGDYKKLEPLWSVMTAFRGPFSESNWIDYCGRSAGGGLPCDWNHPTADCGDNRQVFSE